MDEGLIDIPPREEDMEEAQFWKAMKDYVEEQGRQFWEEVAPALTPDEAQRIGEATEQALWDAAEKTWKELAEDEGGRSLPVLGEWLNEKIPGLQGSCWDWESTGAMSVCPSGNEGGEETAPK
ncbi:hypothetical protein HK104_011008 [Borealophlyctis nickersoniae]|nr:hypothetical protein HK104_011008 [Borealophlyctis nickersoniae]